MAKILLVEDEPLVVRMYQKAFEFDGWKVVTAIGGHKGIEAAKKEKPDLILMDVMMPGMNGIEACGAIKKDPTTTNIPVIMLTNMSGAQDKEMAKKAGATDYIVKSEHKPKELSGKMKKLIGVKEE